MQKGTVGYSSGKSTSRVSIQTSTKYGSGKTPEKIGKVTPNVTYSSGKNSGTQRMGDPNGAPPNKR